MCDRRGDRRGWRRLALCAAPWICTALAAPACAPKALTLPEGRGDPIADAAQTHAAITQACGGARTLTAELSLSGRAGGQRVSGRALAGFEAPGSMRLEGLAPIGRPAFILVARQGRATLLLPRDDRVLRDEAAEDILGALTGVALAPADLQAVLTGCVVPGARAVGGWQQGSWTVIELEGGAALYARRAGTGWQVVAGRRGHWQIEYPAWRGSFPAAVRLVSRGEPAVDVTARLSQLEVNVDLDERAFTVDVPSDAAPISIDELRESGPMRGKPSDDPGAARAAGGSQRAHVASPPGQTREGGARRAAGDRRTTRDRRITIYDRPF